MFTSRAEHRLFLREDNADLRLTEKGHAIGIVDDERYKRVLKKKQCIEETLHVLRSIRMKPTKETQEMLKITGLGGIKNPLTLEDLLKKPEITIKKLKGIERKLEGVEEDIAYQVELNVKYRGYTERQQDMIERTKKLEGKMIPSDTKYDEVSGLSREVIEKLTRVKPISLGQASRVPGVTPASITALLVHFKKTGTL
jgi:tRNA uridine 5-carboxymethylaminomethyl modification enzyme